MEQKLLQIAREVRDNAYCPYSHFAVGAALLAKDGSIYTGCNVENGSYPVGICAERGAFAKAIADGKTKDDFEAIAIVGAHEGEFPDKPCYPCGMCRQVMMELGGEDLKIVLTDRIYQMKEFLPYHFTL